MFEVARTRFGHNTHWDPPQFVGREAVGSIDWQTMQTTEVTKTTVPSKLADLRGVPLAEMATLSTVTFDEALGRVIPDPQTTPAPGAKFSSAI